MRDSSPDDAENRRAKSPPICGRGRSRSKERKPHKHHDGQQRKFVDDGGYEPVGKERSDQASRREAIQPLNKMSQMAAVETKTSFIGSKFSKNSNNKQILPPRKAFTSLPEPPEVNRDTKPTVFDHTAGALINDQLQQQMPKETNGDEGGYEPVGLERRRKDYEDMGKSIPPEYAQVDKTKKVDVKSHEIAKNGLPDEKKPYKKAEKDEQDKKLKEKLEKEQKEKLEKENKLKEKLEKDQKVAEEKERKLKEKLEKEKKEKLEKEEKKTKEKFEKEQREAEEKERKLKERLEKEQKDKHEKEKKLKEKQEKEQKDKEEKERKLKEKLEKEQRETEEKERKLNERLEKEQKDILEKEMKVKEKLEKEQKDKEEKERKMKEKLEKEQKDKEEKERKLKEKLDKEQKDKEEKEKKLKEKLDNEEKEKKSKENKKEFNLTAKPFGQHVKEDYEKNHSKAQETVFLQQEDPAALVDQVMVNTPIVLQDFPSTSSLEEEEELNFSASDQDLQEDNQSFEQPHDEFDELFNANTTRQPPLNNADDGHFDNQFLVNEQEHLVTVHDDDDGCSSTKPPLSEKERKQMEKSLKIQKEKEEKEQKKKEKEEKKKEEKEKKLKAKEDKELEKINKRKLKEEMERQEHVDKANKVKGLLELAKQKNLEQKQKEAFEQSGIVEVEEGDQIMADVPTTNGHENQNIALNDDKETLLTIQQNTSSLDPYFDEDISQHEMMNNGQVDDDFEAQFLSTKNEAANEAVDCETDSGIPGRSRKDQSSKNKG